MCVCDMVLCRACFGAKDQIGHVGIDECRDIARLATAFDFALEGVEDFVFETPTHDCGDRVGDVSVQLQTIRAEAITLVAIFVQTQAAVVAEAGFEVIFFMTPRAMVLQFS